MEPFEKGRVRIRTLPFLFSMVLELRCRRDEPGWMDDGATDFRGANPDDE